jgi:hypothetical protein
MLHLWVPDWPFPNAVWHSVSVLSVQLQGQEYGLYIGLVRRFQMLFYTLRRVLTLF